MPLSLDRDAETHFAATNVCFSGVFHRKREIESETHLSELTDHRRPPTMRGARRPTPMAAGTSVPKGLEPSAAVAAAASLDELIKLPTYSMARIASDPGDFVLRAPFPVMNVSPAAGPMPPVADPRERSLDLVWRPAQLTDVYTIDGITEIMAWFGEMPRYEAAVTAKVGSGLTQPDDLVLDDEYVQPAARGWPGYLIDHIRTGSAAPIVSLEEASPLAPALNANEPTCTRRRRHTRRRGAPGARRQW